MCTTDLCSAADQEKQPKYPLFHEYYTNYHHLSEYYSFQYRSAKLRYNHTNGNFAERKGDSGNYENTYFIRFCAYGRRLRGADERACRQDRRRVYDRRLLWRKHLALHRLQMLPHRFAVQYSRRYAAGLRLLSRVR